MGTLREATSIIFTQPSLLQHRLEVLPSTTSTTQEVFIREEFHKIKKELGNYHSRWDFSTSTALAAAPPPAQFRHHSPQPQATHRVPAQTQQKNV
jgi:hypothetical protein